MDSVKILYFFIHSIFASRAVLIAENLALCQQLLVLQRGVKRPKLHKTDRLFWVDGPAFAQARASINYNDNMIMEPSRLTGEPLPEMMRKARRGAARLLAEIRNYAA